MNKAMRMLTKPALFYTLILFPAIIFLAGLMGCGNKKPIKVGFVECLTGRLSDLGTSGRDGVTLEEMNLARFVLP